MKELCITGKGITAIRKIWRLAKRICRNDVKKKMDFAEVSGGKCYSI